MTTITFYRMEHKRYMVGPFCISRVQIENERFYDQLLHRERIYMVTAGWGCSIIPKSARHDRDRCAYVSLDRFYRDCPIWELKRLYALGWRVYRYVLTDKEENYLIFKDGQVYFDIQAVVDRQEVKDFRYDSY